MAKPTDETESEEEPSKSKFILVAISLHANRKRP